MDVGWEGSRGVWRGYNRNARAVEIQAERNSGIQKTSFCVTVKMLYEGALFKIAFSTVFFTLPLL